MRNTLLRACVFFILCVAIFTLFLRAQRAETSHSLPGLMECMVQTIDPTYASTCLHERITDLRKIYTTAEILAYTSASTTPDTITNQCHAIGHITGEITYKSSGTVEGALAQCTQACRSACTHGVIGAAVLEQMGETYPEEDIAHADIETFTKIAGAYCEKSSSICHGIGHVAFLITQDHNVALDLCDTTAQSAKLEDCYQGVFMERAGMFMNLLFPDTPKIPETRADDYTYPCTSIGSQYRHACFLFLTQFQEPLFRENDIVETEDKLAKAVGTCETLKEKDRAHCFSGIGSTGLSFGYSNIRSPSIQLLCNGLHAPNDRAACTLGTITRYIYIEYRGLFDYCSGIQEASRRDLCFDAAFQWVERYKKAADFVRMCDSSAICLAEYETYKKERENIADYSYGLFGK